MPLTNEQLLEVERLGSLMYKKQKVLELMEFDMSIDEKDIYHNTTPLGKAYTKGLENRLMAIRKKVLEMAERGSLQALDFAKQYFIDIQLDEEN